LRPSEDLPGGDDPVGDKSLEAIGKDVGGDAFVGGQEFLEGAEAAQHHVAEDQEGPAVAKHFDGGVRGHPERRLRAVSWALGMVAIITCNKQVRFGRLAFAGGNFRVLEGGRK